jgi:hypothetical protein
MGLKIIVKCDNNAWSKVRETKTRKLFSNKCSLDEEQLNVEDEASSNHCGVRGASTEDETSVWSLITLSTKRRRSERKKKSRERGQIDPIIR